VAGPVTDGLRPGVPAGLLRAAARADLCSEAHCTTGTSSQQYLAAVMFTHARLADKATTITIGSCALTQRLIHV
jgi:hypothetical protein